MVNNLSVQQNLPALRLVDFSYLVLFFLQLFVNTSDQDISFFDSSSGTFSLGYIFCYHLYFIDQKNVNLLNKNKYFSFLFNRYIAEGDFLNRISHVLHMILVKYKIRKRISWFFKKSVSYIEQKSSFFFIYKV